MVNVSLIHICSLTFIYCWSAWFFYIAILGTIFCGCFVLISYSTTCFVLRYRNYDFYWFLILVNGAILDDIINFPLTSTPREKSFFTAFFEDLKEILVVCIEFLSIHSLVLRQDIIDSRFTHDIERRIRPCFFSLFLCLGKIINNTQSFEANIETII